MWDWLSSLIQTLGSLIPTWHHLEVVDIGVTITRGNKVKILKPGIVWYWPFWTTLYYRASNKQTKQLATQILTTKDMVTAAVGCMVRYKLDDAEKALVETDDVEKSIVDETLAVLCQYITEHTFDDLQTNRHKSNTTLTHSVRSSLREYGVNVLRAQLTDFGRGRCLIHMGQIARNEDPIET